MDPRLWGLALLPVLAAGGFLIAPSAPVLGIIGDRVVLPCQVGPAPLPEGLSVLWTFHGRPRPVPVGSYGGQGRTEEPDPRYRGRVEFFPGQLRAGNVSLLLRDVRSSDQGSYSCHVTCQDLAREARVELQVAAIGDAPSVILRGPEGRGLGLSCRSSGWFPRPELLWLDGRGRARPEPVTATAAVTPGGLFGVEASVRILPGSELELSCRVLNPRLNASLQSRVRIHESFLPSVSRWLQLFLALLFLNLALISGISCLLQRSHKRTVRAGKAKLEMEEEKKKVKSVLDGEKAKKRAAKIEFKKRLDELKAELDFWEARSHAAPVSLGPEARSLDLGDAHGPLPVLAARAALGPGNRYWEVELGRGRRWALGVLRGDPDSGGSPRVWALSAAPGRLLCGGSALGGARPGLRALGVLLDRGNARLEFYDADGTGRVAGTALEEPQGEFVPFVSRGEAGSEPRVRPVPVPVPL